jgi:hypothetical protein
MSARSSDVATLSAEYFASTLLVPTAFPSCPAPKELDMSLMLMNFKGPLVSTQLAERIAMAFFQVRYSGSGLFGAKEPAEIVDLDDRWGVTFENAIFDPQADSTKRLQVKRLGVEICKSNGAIVRIK